MVLLNRRGYSPVVLCRACGKTLECKNCAIALTHHKRSHRMECHYCGHMAPVPKACVHCGSEYVHFLGTGSEKLEELLHGMFPQARIARLDRDTVRGRDDFECTLNALNEGELDLLVGTQMIAKGHDIPGVTLVGVVGADAALGFPDFRAAERTFQLLTQVAGRAGRGDRLGEVLIQSYFPDHYTFQLACTQRFEDFYARESRYRKAMFYPPFTALAGIMVMDRDAGRAATLAREIGEFLDSLRSTAVRILGPAPAPLERIKQVHRHQLLIKSSSRGVLHRMLEQLRAHLEERKIGATRVIVDVDPMSLL